MTRSGLWVRKSSKGRTKKCRTKLRKEGKKKGRTQATTFLPVLTRPQKLMVCTLTAKVQEGQFNPTKLVEPKM